jgi:hypothetical protein
MWCRHWQMSGPHSDTHVLEVGVVRNPDPQWTERFRAADIDFRCLPEPMAHADTVVERPAPWSGPSGSGWDGAAANDGGD